MAPSGSSGGVNNVGGNGDASTATGQPDQAATDTNGGNARPRGKAGKEASDSNGVDMNVVAGLIAGVAVVAIVAGLIYQLKKPAAGAAAPYSGMHNTDVPSIGMAVQNPQPQSRPPRDIGTSQYEEDVGALPQSQANPM